MPRGSGRRPKPTKLKKLAGNPGHRELNKQEPKPPAAAPAMPDGLSELAKKEWRSIVPQLEALGLLTQIDGKALAAYCHAYARWVEAEKAVTTHGLLIPEETFGEEGELLSSKLKRNPAVSISNDALKLMKSFLIEFGLTPASRARLKIEKPGGEDQDPFEKFMKGRAQAPKHVN